MTSLAEKIADLRKQLSAVQFAAKTAREDLSFARAEVEQKAIDEAGGEKALGANQDARERALTLALARSPLYQARLVAARNLEQEASRLDAELEGLKDVRREQESAAKLRGIAALERLGIQSENRHGGVANDDEYETAADALAADVTIRELQEMAAESEQAEALVAAGAVDPDDLPF